ncbi:hypothetical protein [Methylosinus sp. PW1]|uniref:glycine-rich domain-containing protein n=1 Tax=Methylosinus sp. PW1 TaxID=107636 RepID=UPI00068CDAC3|nr:hypothetical protein [Methylosinus sp. PW1]
MFPGLCGMVDSGGPPTKRTVFLLSGSLWTAPPDLIASFGSLVECLGGGGGGRYTGGGGGAYSSKANALTPGSFYLFTVGDGGISAGPGGDTWFGGATFGASICAAKGGGNGYSDAFGNHGGAGGVAASGIGDVTYSGGNGHNRGGGAAGPNGAGKDADDSRGDNSLGGAAGAAGAEWDATHGSGGGGLFGSVNPPVSGSPGGDGGLYGAGGGGGGGPFGTTPAGGLGTQGIIVITYWS